jgi:hypothetical protein
VKGQGKNNRPSFAVTENVKSKVKRI